MGAYDAGDGAPTWGADAVQRLRARLGLSQNALAQLLGVRQQTVSEWETGAHVPRGAARTLLRMIAEARAPYDASPPHEDA